MTLQELFTEELRDLYDAEQQQRAAIPQLAAAARGPALRAALQTHLQETQVHVERLAEAFTLLGTQATRRHCAGIAGILEEGAKLLALNHIEGAVLDAGLIASIQKAEHYEISTYGTCVAWARTLGLHQIASRLEETLLEEEAADQALSDLAVQEVNISATHEET